MQKPDHASVYTSSGNFNMIMFFNMFLHQNIYKNYYIVEEIIKNAVI
jgi:hypothetical protein